ncbi:hypothetical protein [Bordetella genomosp. 13]|uniref:hypothetical protein n=1 Tax=Bordetella genomosp. 13 TaxID=463040 RepID=UPI0011A9905E|nr:hypothetical protein [Bordetella genomosp. 13]
MMRALGSIVACLLACAAGAARAGQAYSDDVLAMCRIVDAASRKIMTARQLGMPMAQVMDLTRNTDNDAVRNLMGMIVVGAYEFPAYRTRDEREQVVADFADTAYRECVKILPEQGWGKPGR